MAEGGREASAVAAVLATPITGKGGLFRTPLDDKPAFWNGRFSKVNSWPERTSALTWSTLVKKDVLKVLLQRGVIGGQKPWIPKYFLITYYRHVCEPILIQQVAFAGGGDSLNAPLSLSLSRIEKSYGGYSVSAAGFSPTLQNKSLFATAIEARRMPNVMWRVTVKCYTTVTIVKSHP